MTHVLHQHAQLDEATAQGLLMERADALHDYIRRALPSDLARVISAEDILQEVCISVFHGLAQFRADGPDSFDRWVTSLVQRRLVDAIRKARAVKRSGGRRIGDRAQLRTTSYIQLFERVASQQRTPSSEDAAKEAAHAVQIALSTLPEDYRCAITMRHIDGRSQAEVASAMARTLPAVNSLLYRGLRMLRSRLEPSRRFFSDGD
jgi:RNA polymerase sigma-70 factor (ECF subfamily)